MLQKTILFLLIITMQWQMKEKVCPLICLKMEFILQQRDTR